MCGSVGVLFFLGFFAVPATCAPIRAMCAPTSMLLLETVFSAHCRGRRWRVTTISRSGLAASAPRAAQRTKPFIAQALAAAQKAGGRIAPRRLDRRPSRLALRPGPGRRRSGEPAAHRPLAWRRGQGARLRVTRRSAASSPRIWAISAARASPGTGRRRRLFGPETDDADPKAFAERVRGRPASFPLHRLTRRRAGDGGPQGLHPRPHGPGRERTSAPSSIGSPSIIGTPSIRTSTSSSAAAPMTARTSSSTATTSSRACAPAPRTWSPRSWGRAPIRRSGSALERQIEAERWTHLDRQLARDAYRTGVIDLAPRPIGSPTSSMR